MPADPDPPTSHFADPEAVARYAEGPRRQVPGFADLHRMIGLLLAERVPATGRVLVLGAGGGLELENLAAAHAGWTFDGVDPSEEMLQLARTVTHEHAARITLITGLVDDAPPGPYDGATCLLTLHFLPRAERRATLAQLHRRLAPGAPLVVAHHSFPQDPAEKDLWLRRYAAYAGTPADRVEDSVRTMGERLPALSPEEDESVLREAGFADVALFYAGLTFRGWVAHA